MRFGLTVLPVLLAASGAQAATTWDGVFAADQAARGQRLYAERCAACHGQTMEGSMNAPPLAGLAFSYVWDGMPLSELFTLIKTTMPSNEVGTISDAQIADSIAAMLDASGFPAGAADLPGDIAALTEVIFQREQ